MYYFKNFVHHKSALSAFEKPILGFETNLNYLLQIGHTKYIANKYTAHVFITCDIISLLRLVWGEVTQVTASLSACLMGAAYIK